MFACTATQNCVILSPAIAVNASLPCHSYSTSGVLILKLFFLSRLLGQTRFFSEQRILRAFGSFLILNACPLEFVSPFLCFVSFLFSNLNHLFLGLSTLVSRRNDIFSRPQNLERNSIDLNSLFSTLVTHSDSQIIEWRYDDRVGGKNRDSEWHARQLIAKNQLVASYGFIRKT